MMAERGVSTKVVSATKWSLVTQLVAKLVSPVTTLILAHLLAPEVFGVVTLVAVVTSFADIFSDAGFQKYLIQHEYEDDSRFCQSCNVAFWTNLLLSFVLWGGISLGRNQLANALGDNTIGLAIVVACSSLPLTSLVSVQTAVYQRLFDFRTLFFSRTGSALAVLLVSVPLALVGCGYWSLIVGTIASNAVLAVWLTICSKWKPGLFYSFAELRRMLAFSSWTLVEAISIWATNWIGAFIVGTMMSTYFVGLYNTTTSSVNAVVSVVASAVNPVVFASLSRCQFNRDKFDAAFYTMQKYLGFVVVPLAVALFVFSDAAVWIGLGESWMQGSRLFGFYALSSAFVVVLGHVASDAYRSLGKPRYSLLAQIGFLLFIVPSFVIGSEKGFAVLSIVVPVARLIGTLVPHFLICHFLVNLSVRKMMFNLRWVYFAAALVGGVCYGAIRTFSLGLCGQLLLVPISIGVYFALCISVRGLRETSLEIMARFGFGKKLSNLLARCAKNTN